MKNWDMSGFFFETGEVLPSHQPTRPGGYVRDVNFGSKLLGAFGTRLWDPHRGTTKPLGLAPHTPGRPPHPPQDPTFKKITGRVGVLAGVGHRDESCRAGRGAPQ